MPCILRPCGRSLQALGANHSRPSQSVMAARGCVRQAQRAATAWFDVAVRAGVRHHRGGAERAFSGVIIRVEFDLCGAIGALDDAGFFDLGVGSWPAVRHENPARGWRECPVRSSCACCRSDRSQRCLRRIKPEVRPQLSQGKRCFWSGAAVCGHVG